MPTARRDVCRHEDVDALILPLAALQEGQALTAERLCGNLF